MVASADQVAMMRADSAWELTQEHWRRVEQAIRLLDAFILLSLRQNRSRT